MITRPSIEFDAGSHTYTLDGDKLHGVSSVAKIGEALDAFSIGSAWGWKLGYEGAFDVLRPVIPYEATIVPVHKGELRDEMKKRGLTPWSTRDRAADRGTWVHDILEGLAEGGDSFDAMAVVEQLDGERKGHAKALLQWHLDFRPSYVATEVQVTSEKHRFAGRYDIRCKIPTPNLVANGLSAPPNYEPQTFVHPGSAPLCLVDLKTSKRIYPLSHYVQLEGYELASVEMGFPKTNLRLVLNTNADGTYEVGVSYATAGHFLAYLNAYEAIKDLQALDPEVVAQREAEGRILALVPGLSRDIARELGAPWTGRDVGIFLARLGKRGLVIQDTKKIWNRVQ